jgi:hypothetical protein
VVHFLFLPNLDIHHLDEGLRAAPVVMGLYASAKMVMWACLLSGCARFQWPGVPQSSVRFLFASGQALAAGSYLAGSRPSDVVNYLYVLILFASVCCTGGAWRVPAARRTRASLALGTALALTTLDLVALNAAVMLPAPPEGRWIVNYNSYVDCVLHLALAACMIWAARSDPAHAAAADRACAP